MRLIKALGLAAFAALAAMAFMASTASADSLCETNVGHANECANPLAENTNIVGLTAVRGAKLLKVEGTKKTVEMECNSEALGAIGANEGSHVGRSGTISVLNFTNCTGLCSKATGENLPLPILLEALALTVKIQEGAKGRGGAVLEECFLVGSCLYRLTNNPSILSVSGSSLIASDVSLTREKSSSFCPLNTAWDATYNITLDNAKHEGAIFATALP